MIRVPPLNACMTMTSGQRKSRSGGQDSGVQLWTIAAALADEESGEARGCLVPRDLDLSTRRHRPAIVVVKLLRRYVPWLLMPHGWRTGRARHLLGC